METRIIYHPNSLPLELEEAFLVPEMLRLSNVGMHCGCEYTAFPIFKGLAPYSRLTHSYGVASIIYHFTGDLRMALAGAFHDIATPCFSHVIDFLHHDHVSQSSTEEGTKEIIENSLEIQKILQKCHILTEEVSDYHRYPIADNDTPKLSSDRLEYTLSNMVNFYFASKAEVQSLYDDIRVGINEYGEEELMFGSLEVASRFGELCLHTSSVYICNEDRFSMERLAELMRFAINKGYMEENDLYLDEVRLLEKLSKHPEFVSLWKEYCQQDDVEESIVAKPHYRKIPAKLRYIDPFIEGKGRLSKLNPSFANALKEFLSHDFGVYLGPSSFFK